jgi:hypothetical protein
MRGVLEQQNLLHWYMRRDGVTRGPFSAEHITRHILLGRIRLEDELSRDQLTWSAAGQLTRLLPEQLRQLDSWDAYRQLVVARLQVDERQGERRCHDCRNRGNCRERRQLADRRQPSEGIAVTFQHHITSGHPRKLSATHWRTLLLALLLASMMLVWLVPIQR